MKSNVIKSLLICCAFVAFLSCQTEKKKRKLDFPKTDLALENMIPKPMKTIATQGGFALDEFTAIYTSENVSDFPEVGQFLAKKDKGQDQS